VIAGEEGAVVVAAVDEGVDGVAVGGDAGGGDATVVVGELGGLLDAACSSTGGFDPGLARVVDPESDGANAVAVLVDVASNVGVGTERSGQDEADFALLEDVAGAVASARLGTCVGDQRHAEGGAVEIGGLTGIAYIKFDVVSAFEGEEVWRGLKCVVLCGGGHGGFSGSAASGNAARQRQNMLTVSGLARSRGEDRGAAFAEADTGVAGGFAGAAEEDLVAVGEVGSDFSGGQGDGLGPVAGQFEEAAGGGLGWAGDGSCGEQVADLEIAAVAGVMGDELSRSPVEITQGRLAQA